MWNHEKCFGHDDNLFSFDWKDMMTPSKGITPIKGSTKAFIGQKSKTFLSLLWLVYKLDLKIGLIVKMEVPDLLEKKTTKQWN